MPLALRINSPWGNFRYAQTVRRHCHIKRKNSIAKENQMTKIQWELQKGMKLAKCRKCGCMKETLEHLRTFLSSIQTETSSDLLTNIQNMLKQMEPIKYSCLGCDYCFPAVAMNMFNQSFPEATQHHR